MKVLFIILKSIFNIILFLFYWFISITTWNFLFGLMLTIFDNSVPGPQDPVHLRIAVLSIAFALVVTLLLRKIFYISVCTKSCNSENKITTEKVKKTEKIINKEEDELEIYVNKEIK